MALPRTSLRGFLTHARYTLQVAQTKQSPVTFVIGNESADLDSIASTLIYAYVASISPRPANSGPATLHIPILNLARSDLALRPELLALLPRANIGPSHLLTLDDLGPDPTTWTTRLPPASTRWILVDHNAFQGRLGALYGSRAVGVIDHHADEGRMSPSQIEAGEPRVIETGAGSCGSLVAREVRERWDAWFLNVSWSGAANGQSDGSLTEDGAFACLWDAQVAWLGLAAGLADTAGLKDEGKTTDLDRWAVGYWETKIGLCIKSGKGYDRERFFGEVQRAREDLGGLCIRDVLRKDYKEWEEEGIRLGTAAVVRPLAFLYDKAQREGKGSLLDHCKGFAEERNLTVVSVMTGYTAEDGKFNRQVLVAAESEVGQKVLEKFRELAEGTLDLQDIRVSRSQEHGWVSLAWQQRNLAASRKQIAPLLRKAMGEV